MKLPRWLVVVLLATSMLSLLAAAGWWWVAWPDHTASEFLALLRADRSEAVLELARESNDVMQEALATLNPVRPELSLEYESRSVSDVILGKRRFKLAGSAHGFEAHLGEITASRPPDDELRLVWTTRALTLSTRFRAADLYLSGDNSLVILKDGPVSSIERAIAGGSGDGSNEAHSRLAVIRTAPEFELVDQSGTAWGSADYDGKVVLVSFVFTTCNGTCPATTHRMALVQRELKSRGLLDDDRVRLLSISLDPARDTPDVLRGYARLYDADLTSWRFLTGPPDEVREVIESWGMWVRPAANGQLDHPSRIYLVDGKQQVREIYNLSFLRPDWVADDVELLLNEAKE